MHPPTFYGATKLAAEQVVETLMGKLKFPYCIGRVFSFTHEHQSPPYLVPTLRRNIAALRDGDALKIDNPSAVRDIQDAEGVIDTVLHLARRAATGSVNIGTGVGRSVAEIALSVDGDADSEQSRRPELGGAMTQGRNPVSALQQRLDSQRSA